LLPYFNHILPPDKLSNVQLEIIFSSRNSRSPPGPVVPAQAGIAPVKPPVRPKDVPIDVFGPDRRVTWR
jgi:hypothetical protein